MNVDAEHMWGGCLFAINTASCMQAQNDPPASRFSHFKVVVMFIYAALKALKNNIITVPDLCRQTSVPSFCADLYLCDLWEVLTACWQHEMRPYFRGYERRSENRFLFFFLIVNNLTWDKVSGFWRLPLSGLPPRPVKRLSLTQCWMMTGAGDSH